MTHYLPARALPTLLLLAALCSCASLPEVSNAMPSGATPTVSNARGNLAPSKARELLAQRWAKAAPELSSRAALEEAATGAPLIAGNKLSLLFDGPQTMQAMMAAAGAAKASINLETYIFDQDEVGQKFADLLIERQSHGVAVHILYDAVGTIGTPAAFFERMRTSGIQLIAFNPINPASRPRDWEINQRDHRKLMVVDGKIAFTGGINISATYANSSLFHSRERPANTKAVGWRDTHVQIEGPAVAALQWTFIEQWLSQSGEMTAREYFPKLAPAGDKLVRVLATAPDQGFEIYRSLILAIQQARKSIHITCAYFVPDKNIVKALSDAAERGVEVKLILPGVSDNSLVYHAGRAYYGDLLERGVHIEQLQVAVLHAKTAVIDGNWSTIGSSNIDHRSFLHNYELNLIVIDPAFGSALEAAFTEDLRQTHSLSAKAWAARPLGQRLKEWAARLFGYWL